ncbi:MAG: DUF7092 domain-containing protein [Hasllibacter sp.]
MTRTALENYARLEASGLWRPGVGAQRREVIVSLGEASLILKDMADRPLSHWSLPATEIVEDEKGRLVLTAGGGEMLEIGDRDMIEAVIRLRRALTHRPRQLRLGRWAAVAAALAVVAVLLSVVPDALRRDIAGTPSRERDARVTAQIADALDARGALCPPAAGLRRGFDALGRRMGQPSGRQLLILRGADGGLAHLPGGAIAVPEGLLRAMPTPEALAARAVAAEGTEAGNARIDEIVDRLGSPGLLRLWTSARLPDAAAEAEAERLMTAPHRAPLSPQDLAATFEMRPWLAHDYADSWPEGIAADLRAAAAAAGIAPQGGPSVPSDQVWVALQEVCAN